MYYLSYLLTFSFYGINVQVQRNLCVYIYVSYVVMFHPFIIHTATIFIGRTEPIPKCYNILDWKMNKKRRIRELICYWYTGTTKHMYVYTYVPYINTFNSFLIHTNNNSIHVMNRFQQVWTSMIENWRSNDWQHELICYRCTTKHMYVYTYVHIITFHLFLTHK
jgi:hypothetical protein